MNNFNDNKSQIELYLIFGNNFYFGMMVNQVEIQLLILADRVGANWALKFIFLLMVLLVVTQGITRLEIAQGTEENS